MQAAQRRQQGGLRLLEHAWQTVPAGELLQAVPLQLSLVSLDQLRLVEPRQQARVHCAQAHGRRQHASQLPQHACEEGRVWGSVSV